MSNTPNNILSETLQCIADIKSRLTVLENSATPQGFTKIPYTEATTISSHVQYGPETTRLLQDSTDSLVEVINNNSIPVILLLGN